MCCVTVRCSGTLSVSVLLADVIKTTCGAEWQAIVRGNVCVNSSAVPETKLFEPCKRGRHSTKPCELPHSSAVNTNC